MKTVMVVAGNREQFLAYVRYAKADHNPLIDAKLEYKYVFAPHALNGHTNFEVVYVGTYYSRKDLGEINDIIPRLLGHTFKFKVL